MQFVLIKAMGYCIIHLAPAKMTTLGNLGELQVVLINSINYNAANVAEKVKDKAQPRRAPSGNIKETFLCI